MDKGFEVIDDASLSIDNNNQLILFKYPKDFNISSLHGQKVKLNTNKKITSLIEKNIELTNTTGTVNKNTVISLDETDVYSHFRPVVINKINGNNIVGNKFNHIYIINEKIIISKINNDVKMLPVRPAYEPIEQDNHLIVNSKYIRKNTTTTDKTHHLSKKTKRNIDDIESPNKSDNKDSKKHKKDKKDKKIKKEKK